MKDINSLDTMLKAYNLIAKIWTYLMDDNSSILGIRSFGQRALNNFNNLSDNIKDFHKQTVENISKESTIYGGFYNIIDLEPDSEKDHLLLKLTIVLIDNKEKYINPVTFVYPRYFSDSNINIVTYLDKNIFTLKIPADDQDKSEKFAIKWFNELFLDIIKILSNTTTNIDSIKFVSAIFAGLFLGGALNISAEKTTATISNSINIKDLNLQELEIQIQLLRNLQEYNSPIINGLNNIKPIIEELERILFQADLSTASVLSYLFNRYIYGKIDGDWMIDKNSNE